MPVSRKRKKDVYTPPPSKAERKAVKFDSPRWLPILMTVCWLIGLIWIVVWYMVPLPLMETLGSWNVAIGFGFIAAGFILATRWR